MNTSNYIVYVEDDEDDQLLMEEILGNQNNVRLVTVSDGQELMEFLNDQRDGHLPCLVIMDNNTPRMSGIETAGKIKEDAQLRAIPLILLTTSPSRNDEDFCQKHNISIFTKPSTYASWEEISRSFVKYCHAE